MPLVADLIPKIHRKIQWDCSKNEVIALALLLNIIKAEDVNGYIKRYDQEIKNG